MTTNVLCIGAGGHASVVIDLLQLVGQSQPVRIAGFVAEGHAPDNILGVPFVGGDNDLPALAEKLGATHFIVAVGSLKGGGALRPRLFENCVRSGLVPFTAVHPSAIVARSVEIGAGTTIMAGAVIQPGVRIGRNAIINTKASIDHDCAIGDHSHLAPGVVCSGGVTVGENAHIGTGAVVIQGVSIGKNATVGAGATVTNDCLAGSVVVGSPARPTPDQSR